MSELLKRLIALLPDKPGVYQMKDENDNIIYIGKAKNLKKRVSQYFLRPQSGKVQAMVNHVHHFDTIIVSSDKEAFILEMNLIQTHYPRYNIMLMDDSHYPYIALKKHQDPLLKIARNTKDQNYFYFGPFPNATAAYDTINLLNKIYPTRKCKNIQSKACLYYSMGQCLAPCVNKIDPLVYDKLYGDIKSFLNGDVEETVARLRREMIEASEAMEYEKAGDIKKTIDGIEAVTSKQRVEIVGDKTPMDVFAYAERDGYRSLAILTYRRGLLLGKHVHIVSSFGEAEEQVVDLISQYYSNHETPRLIVARIEGLKDELESIFDNVEVAYPHEGRLVDAVNLAGLNAKAGLDAHFMSARLEDDNLSLLEELGSILGISTPYRIELFDNSHLQGSSPVGAMVCYINGEPCKKMYRKYHLSEQDAGDDYHSMREITYRRYSRLKEEMQSYPDLILVDGGITQVHATKEALDTAGVDINLFGLYKNDKHETEGLIDGDGVIYPLDNHSPLFFLLMRMQDEVHRFAITFHKQQRSKNMKKGVLDGIAGLGAKRQEMVKMHYPTRESLNAASLSELTQILPSDVAKALFKKLHE